MAIHFFFAETKITLTERTRLKKFIASIFKKEGVQLLSLNYIFCSDDYLLDINRQFLNHDYYTDIITFDISEKGMPVNGEIYISVDRVVDNANTLAQSIKHELHRVLFHGVIHLCGYSDKSVKEKMTMRKKEEEYLSLYFK